MELRDLRQLKKEGLYQKKYNFSQKLLEINGGIRYTGRAVT